MLRGSGPLDLQDMLSESVKWAEHQMDTPTTREQIKQSIQQVLSRFLTENKPLRPPSMTTRELLASVEVKSDNNGRITIDMSAEIRQWLIPPSMISF